MSRHPEYTRHLPHEVPEGFPLFLTWNLKGAMPRAVIEKLMDERQRLEKQPPRRRESTGQRRIRESKIVFAMADRYLDSAVDGPMHLKDPAAAKIVEDSICYGAGERYDLFAWCVMSNHVHVLLTPRWKLERVTQGIKGYTAHEINGLQNERGRVSGRMSRMTTGPAMRWKRCASFITSRTTRSPRTFACDPRSGRGRPRVSDTLGHKGRRTSRRLSVGQARKPEGP
jgi:putative transposase